MTWEAIAGSRHGVESTLDFGQVPWTRAVFSTGTHSVLATSRVVEATCTVPSPDTNRFFRDLEAD